MGNMANLPSWENRAPNNTVVFLSETKQAHLKLKYSHTILQLGIQLIEFEHTQAPKLLKACGLLSWKVTAFICEAWWLGSYFPTHLTCYRATWGRWVQWLLLWRRAVLLLLAVCPAQGTRHHAFWILTPEFPHMAFAGRLLSLSVISGVSLFYFAFLWLRLCTHNQLTASW